ncbi:MAG: translocation/assembly module TamB domain-containing protein [Planctomycetota bacterium]
MSPDDRSSGGLAGLARSLRAIARVVLSLGAAVSLLYILRDVTLAPLLRRALVEVLRASFDIEISLDRVSGTYLDSIELSGFSTPQRVQGTTVAVPRVRASYSLPALLTRGPWLEAIEVEGAKLDIDLREVASRSAAAGEAVFEMPDWLPRLQVKDAAFFIEGTGFALSIAALDLSAWREPGAAEDRLELDLRDVSISCAEFQKKLAQLTARLRYAAPGVVVVDDLLVEDGVRVERARLDARHLAQDSLTFDATLAVAGGRIGTSGELTGDVLRAQLAVNGAEIARVLDLARRWGLRSSAATLAGSAAMQARLEVPLSNPLETKGEVSVELRGARYQDVAAHQLSLRADVTDDDVHCEELSIRSAGGNQAELREIRFPRPRSAAAWADWEAILAGTAAALKADVEDPERLLANFGVELPAALHDFLPRQVSLEARIAGRELVLDRGVLVTGQGSASLDGSTITLDDSIANWQAAVAHVTASLRVDDLESFSSLVRPLDLRGHLTGAVVVTGPLASLETEARLEGEDIRLEGRELGQVSLEARQSGTRATLRRLHCAGESHDVTADGTIDLDSLVLEDAHLTAHFDDVAKLAGDEAPIAGIAHLTVEAAGPVTSPTAVLSLDATRLQFGETLFDSLQARLANEGRRLVLHEITARGPVHLTARGHVDHALPSAALALELDDLRLEWRDERLKLHKPARLSFDGTSRVHFESLAVSLGEEQALEVKGSIPLDPRAPQLLADGELDATIDLRLPQLGHLDAWLPGAPFTSGALAAHAALSGSWSAPRLEATVRAEEMRLASRSWSFTEWPLALRAQVNYTPGRFAVALLEIDSPQALSVSGKGEWNVTLDPRQANDLERWLAEAPLAGELHVTIPDLSWLAASGLGARAAAGRLEGELRLSGTPRAPAVEGTVGLADVTLRPADPALGRIENLHGRLIMSERTLRVAQLEGELGASPFSVAGTIEFDTDSAPLVDARLEGRDLLLYRRAGVKVRADTDIRVNGPVDRLAVTGNVAVTDGRFVKNVDFLGFTKPGGESPSGATGLSLFAFSEPPLSTVSFDVAVTSAKPFRVENNMVAGALRPSFHLRGTGAVPVLVGEVYVEPTKVSLPSGTLRVESGVVRFLESDPFVPVLDLGASARLRSYDVQAAITGPFNNPQVFLSSTPYLPREDLVLLLTTGQLPRRGAGEPTGRSALGAVARYIGQDLLLSFFSDEATESEESLFERFELQTGRDVSRTGTETIEASFRLKDNLLSSRDALYIESERDLYEDFNMGLRLVFRFR